MDKKVKFILKKRFLKYFIVGLCCQFIDYIITLLIFINDKNIFLANLLGYTSGTILSYCLHTKFTFKDSSKNLSSIKQILYFSASCIIGSSLGFMILKIMLINKIDISFGKIMQLVIIAISQFLFNKKFTYKNY